MTGHVEEPRPVEAPRSSVTVWRNGRSLRWSVRVVAGTTQAELDELVDLAMTTNEHLRLRRERDASEPAPRRAER